jgi:hypothetical protein
MVVTPPAQVQARKAECHLAEDAVAHGVEHVVVHADETGNHSIAMQIEHLRVFRDVRGCGV